MKVLAPKNQTISLEYPLTKRRTWRFALVNPRTLVPSALEFMRVNNATPKAVKLRVSERIRGQ